MVRCTEATDEHDIPKMIFAVLIFLGLTATSLQACVNKTTDQQDPWSVQLLQSTLTVNNDFDASINGSSADGQYVIEIVGNKGKVIQNSRNTQVVVNNQIPWGSNLTLYSIIGADSTSILMGWIYCSHDDLLTALWLEDTSGLAGFTNSTVVGNCHADSTARNSSYAIREECITVDPPSVYPSMQGLDVSLQPHNVGAVNLSQEYDLLPFEIVDCLDCGNTSTNGWVEIHSVLSSKSLSNICIGIFCLYAEKGPDPMVLLSYLNCFQQQEKSTQWLPATYDISAYTSPPPPSATPASDAATSFPQSTVMKIVSLMVATIF